MTAKHVIEKLKEDGWYIVAKNEHEIALMFNALFDAGQISDWYIRIKSLDCAVIVLRYDISYCNVTTVSYHDICFLESDEIDISDWFFKEVNNY